MSLPITVFPQVPNRYFACSTLNRETSISSNCLFFLTNCPIRQLSYQIYWLWASEQSLLFSPAWCHLLGMFESRMTKSPANSQDGWLHITTAISFPVLDSQTDSDLISEQAQCQIPQTSREESEVNCVCECVSGVFNTDKNLYTNQNWKKQEVQSLKQ